MKFISIIPVVILFSLPPLAHASTVLKCLGREELQIHMKSELWHLYNLNQDLVNIISTGDNLGLSDQEILEICESKQPSILLLKHLLLESIKNNRDDTNSKNSSLNQYFLTVVRNNINEIFFKYIALIQAKAPTPTCLYDNIPILKSIYGRYRYLQKNIGPEQMLKEDEIEKIFNQLIHVDNYFRSCKKVK